MRGEETAREGRGVNKFNMSTKPSQNGSKIPAAASALPHRARSTLEERKTHGIVSPMQECKVLEIQ